MAVQRFRKKPVEVQAVQWTGGNAEEIKAFVGNIDPKFASEPEPGFITPPDGDYVYDCLHDTWVKVFAGQWVVKGVKGEFYPIDGAVLAETYTLADPDADLAAAREDAKKIGKTIQGLMVLLREKGIIPPDGEG